MKIIRFLAVALIAAAAAFLPGCATTSAQPVTPAQGITAACPPIQAAITQFEVLDASLPTVKAAADAEAALKQIQPVVAAACASGATVSTANVQAFAATVLPVLGQIAGSLPLPPAQLAQIQAGLVVAEVAVGAVGVVEQQIQAAQAANGVPAAAATSAPPIQ
jgi:hypothetical protein